METSKGYVHISTVLPHQNSTTDFEFIDLPFQPNILISNETPPRACIADFGFCTIAPSKYFGPRRTESGGTCDHMAPELFSEGARASKQADMYAFGMVVYEVITGTNPFGRRRRVEVPALILRGWRPPRPEDTVAIGFGQGTWELVERCWDEDPEQRPRARDALEHFEHVSRNSREVDPGPKVPIHELDHPRPGNSSKSLCGYHILV